jgi:hypothetical protein
LASVTQYSIDQTGKMVSDSNNSFGSAQVCFEAAILCPKRCLAVTETLRAGPQRHQQLEVNFARGAVERRSTLPPLIELFGQSPRKELNCSFGVPASHVQADFRNSDLSGLLLDAGDFGEINSTDAPLRLERDVLRTARSLKLREMHPTRRSCFGEVVGIQCAMRKATLRASCRAGFWRRSLARA